VISQKISQYWRVSVVEVTGSTQDDLAALVARNEAINREVLVTEYQSAGRGRLDRTFDAPQSSALLFSLFIEPKREKSEWSFLPLLAGLVSTLAISELDPRFTVELKWPNDLQIAGKKLGGIIAQATSKGVILGIGINVAMDQSELPVDHATSLMIEDFAILDRNLLLASILNNFADLLGRWEDGEDLRHLYRERSATLSQKVQVELPGGEKRSGFAEDISPAGELILEGGQRITVGDIVHLR
jgi:BirA family transcriptional regulator, biotin operon repressor / biotin---[acetyl-CoA-carboxylase] ligase